tara:strand:- start:713 stop:1033 length:321 start_codon:yes stop_codon:yes gene_type:complete
MKSDFDYGTGGAVMSRKDYEAFARVFAAFAQLDDAFWPFVDGLEHILARYEDREVDAFVATHTMSVNETAETMRKMLAVSCADLFAQDNINFDHHRFLVAAGVVAD